MTFYESKNEARDMVYPGKITRSEAQCQNRGKASCYKSLQHEELVLTVQSRVNSGETYLGIADESGVSAALVRKVYLYGVDSKKLKAGLGIKAQPRTRLHIDCDEELKTRFMQGRGDKSSSEYLAELLDKDGE